jgi:stearoyl-CoA desaturase (Delta-9 desaturase)
LLERTAEGYDGAAPFPDAEPPAATTAGPVPVAVTAAIAGVPFAGIVAALWLAWGHGVGLVDMLLMAGLYVVTWLGVTVASTGASPTAASRQRRCSGSCLRSPGSMSFQGSVIGWVATHRRQTAA